MANNLRLSASLGLDKTGFDAGLRAAASDAVGFASDLKSTLAGAFTVAAVTQFVRGIVTATGRIKDLSEQFTVTTDEVQNMDFALKQSGLAFEDLGKVFTTLAQKRREAVEGNMELRETFQKYGLTLGDLNNAQLRTVDILNRIAASQRTGNQTAREQGELMDLLGSRSLKLINVIKDLETFKAPEIISNQDIRRIDDATKALQRLKLEAQSMAAPAVGFGATILRAGIAGLGEFMTKKGGVAGPQGKLAAGIGGFDAVLKEDFMRPIKELGDALGKGGNGVVGDLFGKILGVPDRADQLWKVGGKAAAQPGFTAGFTPPDVGQPDQFQRIGAFTSVSAQAAQTEMQRRSMTALERIRDDLQRRGILVRTDP